MLRDPIDTGRDVYANLLRDSRGLRREQSTARDVWFASLGWERKEESLFELEMLLKGLGCFGNARNHAGPRRTSPSVSHDFQDELRIVRDTLEHCIALIRKLLGKRDRAYAFSRYLESVMPEDAERSKLLRDQLSQETPEEALFVLRNAFSAHLEIVVGVARLGRISHRLYYSILGNIAREVGRNAFFNPLVSLEFRPEYDRIRVPEVLEALGTVDNEAAHRVTSLTFLSLFRGLRYLDLIDEYALDTSAIRRAHVVLAVLRSDMRAITRFLARRAADVITNGLERELLTTQARDIAARYDELAASSRRLVSLRSVLENVANTLRIEVRTAFARPLLSPHADLQDDELAPQLIVTAASLRASLHHAILLMCRELRPDVAPPQLASSADAKQATSERLRRDVWMFSQILRAFLAKARATTGHADQWASYASFHFVREFIAHFRAIGYQLVRMSDYEHLDRFLRVLEGLRDVDLLEPARLEAAIRECTGFYEYLNQLFHAVSRRAELADVPFDKRSAAETLKVYLGAA